MSRVKNCKYSSEKNSRTKDDRFQVQFGIDDGAHACICAVSRHGGSNYPCGRRRLGLEYSSNGPSAYTTWASTQTFRVGDVLLFNFITGFHNVAEVSQAAYGPCSAANPISIVTTGPARVTLKTPGTHYYVCTVGTHCQIGQKLTINVSATAATLPPAPAPATPIPVSPLTVSTILPPPSPSFAPSFIAVVSVSFLAMVLAFFY
ncbi:unnamed protein product [Lactuca saligna]|uniref:Phytocyanin domain-containing protein n=1 Tax=Lactuca saligna TaxID=75948 RepID=A0AA35Z4T0_LACSI|nr:unnamed protein product [Lactuca saligna]